MRELFFVDVEAEWGKPSPFSGRMTEFACVTYPSRFTFERYDDSSESLGDFSLWVTSITNRERATFVSDNPAYDWQWINYYFDKYGIKNPFGYSARRIGDFYAGLVGDFGRANEWKKLRVTPHTHKAIDDVMGNVEAFERLLAGERP